MSDTTDYPPPGTVGTGTPPQLPPNPINNSDDQGCRSCGMTTQHLTQCELAKFEGRIGPNGPDYVRGMDCLPGDHPVAIRRAAEVAEARERAEEQDRRRAEKSCHSCGLSQYHAVGCRVGKPGMEVRPGQCGPPDSELMPPPGRRDTPPTLVAAGDWVDPNQAVARVKRVRDEIFETAAALVSGDREDDYGSAIDNFTAIGKLWAVTFGVDTITPMQVAIALAQLKQARLLTNPYHRDSWVDGVGYMGLGGDIAAEVETRNNPFS